MRRLNGGFFPPPGNRAENLDGPWLQAAEHGTTKVSPGAFALCVDCAANPDR
jgi:hypothetical protein